MISCRLLPYTVKLKGRSLKRYAGCRMRALWSHAPECQANTGMCVESSCEGRRDRSCHQGTFNLHFSPPDGRSTRYDRHDFAFPSQRLLAVLDVPSSTPARAFFLRPARASS